MGFTPTERNTSTTNFRHELLTLEEVYGIEFNTRAYWKMTFSNGPSRYANAMIAQSCQETSRQVQNKKMPAGNWYSFVPQIQHQGQLSCTLYDDRLGTIEKWARQWWASTNHNQVMHNLEYPTKFSAQVFVYHYNMQYDLLFTRAYIVIPSGAITTQFDTSINVSTVKLNFDVQIYTDN